MSRFWTIALLFIFFSCQVKENQISKELLVLKNDMLSDKQIDSILITNEIPRSEWDIHKTDSIDGIYIPYNLYDCFSQIDAIFPDSVKLDMIQNTDREIIGQHHFGYGLWMRNNWGLWRQSRLWIYFYNKGVYHPDDVSSLILKMYHRKINNTELSFQRDVESIKKSIVEANILDRKEKDREITISSLVNIDDSIEFQLPIDLKYNTIFYYAYPALIFEDQDQNRDSMLIIKGIVTDKIYTESDSIANYRIRILDLSQVGIIKNDVGDELEMDARNLYLIN